MIFPPSFPLYMRRNGEILTVFTSLICSGGGGGGDWEEDGKSVRDKMEKEAKKELEKTIHHQFQLRKSGFEKASDIRSREIPADCVVSREFVRSYLKPLIPLTELLGLVSHSAPILR